MNKDTVTSSVSRVYDSRHNVLREAAAVGAAPVYTRNATHYQWHPTLSLPLAVSDSENITNHFTWSDSGLLQKMYDSASTNTFGYTSNGQIAVITNANGHAVTFSYDALGHPYLITPQTGPAYRTLHDSNGYLTNSALPTLGGGWKRV
jgi:YD repeat-containing protein